MKDSRLYGEMDARFQKGRRNDGYFSDPLRGTLEIVSILQWPSAELMPVFFLVDGGTMDVLIFQSR